MSDAEELCPHCGAPRAAGFAACKFCKTPFVKDTQTGAIPCPRCNTLNELGAQRCVQCQTWVVVQCVFCHALSPHNVPACTKCSEPFAGAPQRFADQQRQQHIQQGLSIAGTVGNVAASFLGAAAGAGLFSHHEGYEHHHGGYGPPQGYGSPLPYGAQQQGGWGQGAGIAAAGLVGAGAGLAMGSSGSQDDYQGAGIAASGPGNDDAQGAGIAQSSDGGGGGGFFDSLFGGSSSDSSGDSGAGIAQSNDASGDSGDSGGSGGWFDDNS
jgi:hypothetical protein